MAATGQAAILFYCGHLDLSFFFAILSPMLIGQSFRFRVRDISINIAGYLYLHLGITIASANFKYSRSPNNLTWMSWARSSGQLHNAITLRSGNLDMGENDPLVTVQNAV